MNRRHGQVGSTNLDQSVGTFSSLFGAWPAVTEAENG